MTEVLAVDATVAAPHVVVVGLGSIGRRHATNLHRLIPTARFTFVRHRGGEDEFTRQLGGRVVCEVSDALDDEVDLAVVASPSADHMAALEPLIAAGCPLVVEKPIVTSARDCDRVMALLAAAPPAVRVSGFNLRHLPSLRAVRAIIEDETLGPIVRATFIAGQWLPDWRPQVDYRESYSADAGRGGGVELDLAHEFDAARWLLGDLEVAYAVGRHATSLELAANDVAIAVLARPGGSPPLVTVAVDYVSRRRVRWYEIVGERGRIEWSLDGRLELATAEGVRSVDAGDHGYDVAATYEQLLREALDAAGRGDDQGVQTLADGVASTRLALRVRELGAAG